MNRSGVLRLVRFASVNAVGTAIDVSLVFLLAHVLSAPLLLAVFCGWASSMLTGFFLNHLFVFADGRNTVARAGVRYLLLVAINLAVGVGGVTLLVSAGWPYLPTRLASSTLLVLFNYGIARSWVFAVETATGTELALELADVVGHQHPGPGDAPDEPGSAMP